MLDATMEYIYNIYNYLVCFNYKLYSGFVKLFQNITCFPFPKER